MIIRLIRKISTQISASEVKFTHKTLDIEFKKYPESMTSPDYHEAYVKDEQIEELLLDDVVAVEIIQ